MAKELGAESFALDMEFLIGEYEKKLAEEDTKEGKILHESFAGTRKV